MRIADHEIAVTLILTVLVCAIFAVDIVTPADNVSICFAYCGPIFFGILTRPKHTFFLAGLATVLSIIGSIIQPPNYEHTMVFVGNRVIAVLTQWAVAALVFYRRRNEILTQTALEEAVQQHAAGRRFLDVLSHEIGTPLTTIAGQAFRLGKLAPTMSPQEIATRATKIRIAARRIERLIAQVQVKQELEEQLITPAFQPVELPKLIEDATQELLSSEPSGIINLDLERLPRQIEGDPALLSQIFENILTNALKYSKPRQPITLVGMEEDKSAIIQVMDQGIGIPAADCLNVFSPYFRAQNTGGIRGIGIGLYLTKRFVDAHGGSIKIMSREGLGTTVTVSLPVSPVISTS
jgi:signal transduction histidine kinase